jgi:hypothetical protein
VEHSESHHHGWRMYNHDGKTGLAWHRSMASGLMSHPVKRRPWSMDSVSVVPEPTDGSKEFVIRNRASD